MPYALPEGSVGRAGVKLLGGQAGQFVAFSEWVVSGGTYLFILDLNTSSMEGLFADAPDRIPMVLEIEWQYTLSGLLCIQTARPLAIDVLNDYITGNEGTPAAMPDQKATQAQAESGTANDKWMTPLRVKQAIAASPPAAHGHAQVEITDLVPALSALAAADASLQIQVNAKATAAQGAKADSALQSGAAISAISGLQTALDGKQAAGSYATLVGGIIPSGQLPSYVDDVLEFATLAAFPATGESGKIYVATGTNKTYRWSGSAYVEIASSPGSTDVVVEGSTNLYFTAARAVAALASTLASYATQAWVTAQGYVTQAALDGKAAFQPSPEYAADAVANALVSNTNQGFLSLIFARQGVDYYQSDNEYAISRNGQSNGGVAGSWLLEYVGENGGPVVVSTTATTYPWQATWPSGTTVVKAPLSRLVGAPLAATAAEGTSAYAARADHVHPFPTAAQIGAAPAGSYVTLDGGGKIPSSQLPSYVDDVIEVANFAALPKIAYTVSGSTVTGVNGEYVITASLYNFFPTYENASLGNTLRRRASNVTNPSRWEIVNGATQRLVSNFSEATPDTSWPSSTAVVYSENSGQGGKIYVTLDTGKCYRWSGSTYIEISSTLELDDLQIPDAFASVYANVPGFTTRELPLTGTLNGKPRYTGTFYDEGYEVYWTGTNWKAQASYSGDGYSYGESIATGNTAYPWQAAGWTNGGGVTRVGTYNAALAPAPLGADAYSGVGTKAAREDHVHPLPTPAQIGAATAAHTHGSDTITEGSTNLFFTAARAVSALASTLANYATTSALNSTISGLATVYTTTAAVASQITAYGYQTASQVSSAISSALASYATTASVTTALSGKAATSHTHAIADTTGLQTALDGKQASGSYANATHTHAIADTTGLQTALDGKASVSDSIINALIFG
jgi:hypothetical protein